MDPMSVLRKVSHALEPRVRSAQRPRASSRSCSVVGLSTGLAATVVSAGSLPPCRLADTTTAQRAYTDWNRTVLDVTYRLPTSYAPGDLRSTANAGLNGGPRVRALVIADLKAMARAARNAGARLAVQSAYRSYSNQRSTFAYLVARVGLLGGAQVERPGRPQRAPARDDRRLPELRRIGALVLRGLGHLEGRGRGSRRTPGSTAS